MPRTFRYSIEMRDVDTGETLIFTTADWTEEERASAVAQILYLCRSPQNQAVAAMLQAKDKTPPKG